MNHCKGLVPLGFQDVASNGTARWRMHGDLQPLGSVEAQSLTLSLDGPQLVSAISVLDPVKRTVVNVGCLVPTVC